MEEQIKEILNEIKNAEEKDEVIFPILLKLVELRKKNPEEFKIKWFKFKEDEETMIKAFLYLDSQEFRDYREKNKLDKIKGVINNLK